jgi:hypothetical protein
MMEYFDRDVIPAPEDQTRNEQQKEEDSLTNDAAAGLKKKWGERPL